MEITLGELLLSNFFKKSQILAGKRGVSKKVSSVTVLDSPDAFKYLKGGEFIVTTAYSLLNDEEIQNDVIEKLAEHGAAGLGIKLRFFKNKLPKKIKEKADEIGFPIISIANEYAYTDILEFVMLNMVSNLTKEVKRIDEVYKEINKSINTNGFLGVAKTLHKWTGLNILIIFDNETYSYPDFDLPRYFPMKSGNWNLKPWKYETVCSVSYYNWEMESFSLGWLGTEMLLDGRPEGHVLLFEGEREFNKNDFIILDYAASACSMEIQRIKSLKAIKRKYKKEFMEHLFKGTYTWKEAKYQAEQLDFSLTEEGLIVAVIKLNGIQYENYTIEKIDLLVLDIFGENAICCLMEDDYIYVLLNSIHQKSEPLIEKLYDNLENTFGNCNCIIGIGRTASLTTILKSISEAKKAIIIGSCIGIEPAIFYFSKLGFYRLLNFPEANEEIMQFYCEYLEPLELYDNKNNSSLLGTLQNYIASGYNYRDTAQKMFVHPNTVRYRVSIIEKLSRVDLKSTDDRLNMEIALKILPLLKNPS